MYYKYTKNIPPPPMLPIPQVNFTIVKTLPTYQNSTRKAAFPQKNLVGCAYTANNMGQFKFIKVNLIKM